MVRRKNIQQKKFLLRFQKNLSKNTSICHTDKIIDIYDKNYTIDLSKFTFIPSGNFESFEKLIAVNNEERVKILHDYYINRLLD